MIKFGGTLKFKPNQKVVAVNVCLIQTLTEDANLEEREKSEQKNILHEKLMNDSDAMEKCIFWMRMLDENVG